MIQIRTMKIVRGFADFSLIKYSDFGFFKNCNVGLEEIVLK